VRQVATAHRHRGAGSALIRLGATARFLRCVTLLPTRVSLSVATHYSAAAGAANNGLSFWLAVATPEFGCAVPLTRTQPRHGRGQALANNPHRLRAQAQRLPHEQQCSLQNRHYHRQAVTAPWQSRAWRCV
jgi:hypothetical protein